MPQVSWKPVTSNMQQVEIWVISLFLSRQKCCATYQGRNVMLSKFVVLSSSMKFGPGWRIRATGIPPSFGHGLETGPVQSTVRQWYPAPLVLLVYTLNVRKNISFGVCTPPRTPTHHFLWVLWFWRWVRDLLRETDIQQSDRVTLTQQVVMYMYYY